MSCLSKGISACWSPEVKYPRIDTLPLLFNNSLSWRLIHPWMRIKAYQRLLQEASRIWITTLTMNDISGCVILRKLILWTKLLYSPRSFKRPHYIGINEMLPVSKKLYRNKWKIWILRGWISPDLAYKSSAAFIPKRYFSFASCCSRNDRVLFKLINPLWSWHVRIVPWTQAIREVRALI